jgi:hypothetical protein
MSTISLLAPVGTGLSSNSSPSLTPINGALGVDSTQVGTLYIGNGSIWQGVSPFANVSSTFVNFTLTASGQPNITGSIFLTKMQVGSIPFVIFQVTINASITITANSTWTMASAIVSPYQPSINCYFSVPLIISSNVNTSNAYLEITTAGTLNLGISTVATVTIQNVNGSYFV